MHICVCICVYAECRIIIPYNQMGFIPGIQSWSRIQKIINLKYHIIDSKSKNNKVISVD